jgi:hypothetical protein
MATDAQIAANRRNALRSTGPRTPEGKARSSRNHLVHGLLAKGLIEGESQEEFLAVYEDFHAEYDPQTRSEEALVERIALAYFRLGRFTHVEAQFLQREHAEKEVPAWSAHAQPFDRVANSYRNNMRPLHNLSLYVRASRAIPVDGYRQQDRPGGEAQNTLLPLPDKVASRH